MIARKRGVVCVAGALGGVVALVVGGGAGVAVAAGAGPANLGFSPSPYSFGSVVVGNTASNSFTLANTGGRTARAVTATLVGSAEFSITANSCTAVSLRPSASCTVSVQFAPTSAGTAGATLRAVDRKGAVLATDALTGTGPTGQHLYWTNYDNGTIVRAGLNGSGVTTLVSGLTHPIGVAADASHIYWSDAGSGAPSGGRIMRANLDGSGVTTLASGQAEPIGVAVDANFVYWANTTTGTIMKANLDGTGATLVRPGVFQVQWLAVDANHLYWTAGLNYIEEANLDGSHVNTYFGGDQMPFGIAVDANSVYFSDLAHQTIERSDLPYLPPSITVVSNVGAQGVAVDANHIYWADGAGTINENDIGAFDFPVTLYSGPSGPEGLAVGP